MTMESALPMIPTLASGEEAAWDGYYGNLVPRYDTDRTDVAASAAAGMADALLAERRKRKLPLDELTAWDGYVANLGPKYDVNRQAVAAAAAADMADAMLVERRRRVAPTGQT